MKKLFLCALIACVLCAVSSCGQLVDMLPVDSPLFETFHKHTIVTDAGREATCASLGLTEGSHCSVCNAVLTEQTSIPMIPHTPVTDAGREATCDSLGLTEGSHCSVCNAVLTEQKEIPMLSHTPVVDAGYPATASAEGLTDGMHCSVCDKVLVEQTVISPIPGEPITFGQGTVTTEPTVITTEHLEFRIDENVYIPANFVRNIDLVTYVMEEVSGMKFSGNPQYADGKLVVYVRRGSGTESEGGEAYATYSEAVVSPIQLLEWQILIHETTHTLQSRQSWWHYCQWAMEGITEYTVYKTKAYFEEHQPNLLEFVGTTDHSIYNMTITDYDKLYEHSMEYWIDNTFEYAFNANYTIGFRLMWYLDTTYGNYTDWIYRMEEAYPMHANNYDIVNNHYSDQLPNEKILEAFYMTYGESVFDDFYAWLKQNEGLFEGDGIADLRSTTAISILPKFHWEEGNSYRPSVLGVKVQYKDLYMSIDEGIRYLTEYKGKTVDTLQLELNEGVTVKLFNAKGECMKTVTARAFEPFDITGVSGIQLVGEGILTRFVITGFH